MNIEQKRKIISDFFGHDKYLRINYELIDEFGLTTAALLSELWWMSEYFTSRNELTDDGYFYRSREMLEKRLGLSEYLQRKHLETVIEKGFVLMKNVPDTKGGTKCYYKIDVEKLFERVIN